MIEGSIQVIFFTNRSEIFLAHISNNFYRMKSRVSKWKIAVAGSLETRSVWTRVYSVNPRFIDFSIADRPDPFPKPRISKEIIPSFPVRLN